MARLTFLSLFSVLLACGAAAQNDDAAYCKKLGDYASRYLGDAGGNGGTRPDFDTIDGIDKCNKGNTAAGIAI